MDVMTDIETLGSTPGSVIFEIGWCFFTGDAVHSSGKVTIDIEDSWFNGFTTSPETVNWWMKNGHNLDALIARSQRDKRPAIDSLKEFAKQIGRYKIDRYWSKGNFDYPLLEVYFDRFNLKVPWKYYDIRELRTALDVLGADSKYKAPHDAEQDAVLQATLLINARKQDNGKRKD